LFFQAGEALFEEVFAPLADDLSRGVQACGNGVIVEALGSVEDDLGPDDVSIRLRICSGERF
jgi:hypothetical protein